VNAAELCKTREPSCSEQLGLSLREAIHSFSTDSVENQTRSILMEQAPWRTRNYF
jgi:hypothetical protein